MREKLMKLMKNEGLSSSRLAEILEIQPSTISHIISGRNKPGFDFLVKILQRFPDLNPDWLLLDSPQMYRQTSPKDNPLQNPHAESTINQLHPDSPTVDNQPSRAATDDLFSAMAASRPSQQAETQTIKQKPLQATTPNSPRITDTQNRTELGQSSSDKDKLYTSDNPTNSNTHEPKIVRIIVCMDDGTCENYSARMR